MSDRKAVIKNADMSEEMQQDSVECATQALEKYNIEKDIAAYIKKVHALQATKEPFFKRDIGIWFIKLNNQTSIKICRKQETLTISGRFYPKQLINEDNRNHQPNQKIINVIKYVYKSIYL